MIKLSCSTKEIESGRVGVIVDMIKRALKEHVKSGKELKNITISIKDNEHGETNLVLS